MPLTKFECPDGETILIPDCLESCRMSERCIAKSTLQLIQQQNQGHEWDGIPHVTELVGSGARSAYLKHTEDYSMRPWLDPIDIMIGVAVHLMHERMAAENGDLAEYKVELMEDGKVIAQGTVDYLEMVWLDDNEPAYDLIDFKTWGIHKAMKVAGLKKTKGMKYAEQVPPDFGDEGWQLNVYRLMLEDLGFLIRNVYIQPFVKEGGWAFSGSGLGRKAFLAQVPEIPDNQVRRIISMKSLMLRMAMENMVTPPVCTPEERWQGDLKCKSYCEVASFCSHGKLLKGLK